MFFASVGLGLFGSALLLRMIFSGMPNASDELVLIDAAVYVFGGLTIGSVLGEFIVAPFFRRKR